VGKDDAVGLMLLAEQLVQTTRKALQAAREAYSTAISQRSGSQREVNELLQRKHAWTPNDLERFTALYRSDHANEQAETAAQDNLVAVERRAEEATAKLSASILARYHEEQIWSDKIRRMSTWGTWGLMGVNILLFLVFQIGVEPWRRRRLVKGFEEKVMEALGRDGTSSEPAIIFHQATEHPSEVPPIVNEHAVTPGGTGSEVALLVNEASSSENIVGALGSNDDKVSELKASENALDRMQDFVRDLFSHREVVISRVEMTATALEGAAAGAILATALLMLPKFR